MFNILEASFEVTLVKTQRYRTVPGRETAVKDGEWLAHLLEQELLHATCIPPCPMRERCDLTRHRKTLIQERASEINRVHKLLESAILSWGWWPPTS
jgi:transposase